MTAGAEDFYIITKGGIKTKVETKTEWKMSPVSFDFGTSDSFVVGPEPPPEDPHEHCVNKTDHLDILWLAVALLVRNGGTAIVSDEEYEELFGEGRPGDWRIAQMENEDDVVFTAVPPEVISE